jgi:hypothetical protein
MTDHFVEVPKKVLSTGAQFVLDAAFSVYDCEALYSLTEGQHAGMIAATALRAVADQVAPSDAVEPRNYLPMAIECQRIRSEILAIATELENQP